MLTRTERDRIVHSWRLVRPIADTASEMFYRRLFELEPEYRALFPKDMSGQRKKLLAMLNFIVNAIDWSPAAWAEDIPPEEDLFLVVLALGRRHTNLYQVPESSYAVVGEVLLWTLEQGLGPAFHQDVRSAWTRLYQLLARIMVMGGRNGRMDMSFGRPDRTLDTQSQASLG